MRDTQCHACALNNFVVTSQPWHLGEKCLNISEFSPPTWHALLHLTRIATHPHAHCHEFFPHWHAKLRAMTQTVCCASVRLALFTFVSLEGVVFAHASCSDHVYETVDSQCRHDADVRDDAAHGNHDRLRHRQVLHVVSVSRTHMYQDAALCRCRPRHVCTYV